MKIIKDKDMVWLGGWMDIDENLMFGEVMN